MESDNLYMIGLILLGGIGILLGLSLMSGSGITDVFSGSGLFASAFAAVETSWTSQVGQFLITFDNFKNTHQEILDPSGVTRIFDVNGFLQKNVMWVGTDHGLFLSRDGGLTWNRFTSSNNEINANSIVFKIVPASGNGEDFFISVFSNGQGAVYRTYDYFFNLEKLMDFDGEGAYDIYRSGNYLYFAMSTGQIIRFNSVTKESRVVNVFSAPVLKITNSNNKFYVLLKDGALLRGDTLDSKFSRIQTPGSWFFGPAPLKNVVFDGRMIYLLTKDGAYQSADGGLTFSLMKHIPLMKAQIDALGVHNGIIYAVSVHKLYVSRDGGENWAISDLPNQFQAFQFYFVKDRILLSM